MYNVLPDRARRPVLAVGSVIAIIAATVTTIGFQVASGSTQLASTTGVFGVSAKPVQAAEQDAQAVELGAVFHVTKPGWIVGIRYYKSAQNSGVHVGTLWTATGSLLARAFFTNESTEGWQSVRFDTPVPVRPNVDYVAAYHTDTGYYAQQQYAFAAGKTLGSGPVIETKGVYRYGAEGFPTLSWHDSSYYVDVLFTVATSTNVASENSTLGLVSSAPKKKSSSHRSSPSTSPLPTSSSSAPMGTAYPAAPSTSITPTTAGSSPSSSNASASPSPAGSSVIGAPPPSGTSSPTIVATTPSPTQTYVTPPVTVSSTPTASSSTTASSMSGCWSQPSACGYPDATNTGVEPGITLKPSGSLTITQSGSVVQNLLITGELDIFANNVTVRNVKIIATGGYHALYTGWSYTGIVIDHVEIDGRHLNPSVPGLVGGGFTATAVNIHGTGDAIDIGDNVTVKDSYLHDLTVNSGDHTDGVQSTGSNNDLITHCTIDATLPGGGVANSALIIGADLSDMGTVNVANNLLGGGNYTIYAGADPGYDSGTINFTNNRFAKNARYGPCSFGPSPGRTIGFTGNVWDATNAPLSCS